MLAPAPESIDTVPCTGSTWSCGCWADVSVETATAAPTASAGTRRVVTVPTERSVDRRGEQIRPPLGCALIDGDREEAAHGVGVHHRRHVHRSPLAEQLGDLGKGGWFHLLVPVHLASETDDRRVLFVEAG